MSIELEAVNILEVFSPKSFTDPALCSKMAGLALDLWDCKPYGPNAGEFGDLNKPNDVNEFQEIIDSE